MDKGMEEERDRSSKTEKNFIRGRNYLIHLLAVRDYTTKEIENKLKKEDYPDEVVEEVIQYGLERHYLDDMRYAEDYIRFRQGSKSIRQLKYQLSQKGIANYILDQIEVEDSREELLEQVIRYRNKKAGTDYEKDAKTYQYFVRKGYNSSLVKDILRNISHK